VTRIIGEGKPADALCALPLTACRPLLVGGPDGIVRQYEPQTGALRRQQQIGDGAIRDLAVAERSGSMVVAVASEGCVRLWATEGRDTEPVKFVPRPQRARPFRICFSGDESARYLVCAFTDGWLAAWDLDAVDQEPNWRQAHSGPIWTLIDLDDDDRREPLVASGGSDRSLCVWGMAGDGSLVARQKFEADGTIRASVTPSTAARGQGADAGVGVGDRRRVAMAVRRSRRPSADGGGAAPRRSLLDRPAPARPRA
jgi:WD40 repeat protein